jgi:8-oxo-dGTP pyrophosphatase MutT (NUDIX family)
MKESPWQSLSSEQKYKNNWVEVVEHAVVRPDGSDGIYGVVHVRAGVFIVALTDDNRVYLVHLYRFPRQQWAWELPAGGVEDNIEPLENAKNELAEELGLQAAEWLQIGRSISSITGVTDDSTYVFLARSLSNIGKNKQHEEGISETKTVTIEELFKMVDDGIIHDAQSLASIMYFRRWLDNNKL